MLPIRQIELPLVLSPLRIRALDVSALDELLHDGADPDRLPYWSALWPSAAVLAAHLTELRGWQGERVLELGCGPGLTGIALAAAGARVIMTDLFPEAVGLACENALRNGIATARLAAADWNTWPFRAQWPVIVGSDLTYERHSHAALLQVLDAALAPNGAAYLADPGRAMSLDFFARAEASGWHVDIRELPRKPESNVFLYRLRRW